MPHNEGRLWLSVLAYDLVNLWRRLALPAPIGNRSLTSLQQRLVKTGGRLIGHAPGTTGRCWQGSTDPAVVWRHAAEDRNAAIASGIGGLQSAPNFGDEIGRQGDECLITRSENPVSGALCHREAELGPLRRNGKGLRVQTGGSNFAFANPLVSAQL